MVRLIIITLSLLGFLSCGEGMKVSNFASSLPGGQTCGIDNSPTVIQSLPTKKLYRDEFYMMMNDPQGSSKVLSTSILGDLTLDEGTKLSVTVNSDCLLERAHKGGTQNYLLTKGIFAKAKKPTFSREETHHLKLPSAMALSSLEKMADQDTCVVLVSRNLTLKTQAVPNDPRYSEQSHLTAINFGANYDWLFNEPTSIKNNTIIAVIDNGVDINHQDLQGHLWINTTEQNGTSGVDDDNNGYVDDIYGYDFASNNANPNHKYPANSGNLGHSHGSHVAGLAAATTNNALGIAGVMAKYAKVMSLNVFGNSNGAYTSNIDNAIRYAADMGAKVINLSLGGPGAAVSTQRALEYAVEKGAFVVVAAGNDSQLLTASNFVTPASYGATLDGMVTVGATNARSSGLANLCSFSNRSTTYVEIGAPGCDTSTSGVLSLLRSNGYGLMQGTSMASPVAAGVAAAVFSYVRDRYNTVLTPAQLETLLKSGSKNFSQLNSYIKDGKNTDLTTLKDKIIEEFGTGEPEIPNPCP